jgi:hypothetical protein
MDPMVSGNNKQRKQLGYFHADRFSSAFQLQTVAIFGRSFCMFLRLHSLVEPL